MTTQKVLSAGLIAMFALALFANCLGSAAEKDGGFVLYPTAPGSPGPVLFSHRAHSVLNGGYACSNCHASALSATALNITMELIRQGRSCGACHGSATKGASSQTAAMPVQTCSACHMPGADIVITLNRMDPVAFSHVRHLGADQTKKVSKPAGFSCGDCHPKLFERISKGPIGMEVPHETGGCAECHTGKSRADGLPSAFAANTRCLTCHKSQE